MEREILTIEQCVHKYGKTRGPIEWLLQFPPDSWPDDNQMDHSLDPNEEED